MYIKQQKNCSAPRRTRAYYLIEGGKHFFSAIRATPLTGVAYFFSVTLLLFSNVRFPVLFGVFTRKEQRQTIFPTHTHGLIEHPLFPHRKKETRDGSSFFLYSRALSNISPGNMNN